MACAGKRGSGLLVPIHEPATPGWLWAIAKRARYMLHAPDLSRRIGLAAALLALVIVVGTFGFMDIEGWSWFDSLYMTVTTFTTIGGGEPAPLNVGGKIWTMVVVIVGFGVLSYTLLTLMSYALEGQLGVAVERRRVRRQIKRMTNHFVLCGYGRVGSEIARDFVSESIRFIVIDVNEQSLGRAAVDGHAVVRGNASDVAAPAGW
jgi:voltage-gated potassium channel